MRYCHTLILFIAGFLILASCKKHDTISGIQSKDSLYIFVMAGQSNMAGRGELSPSDTLTDPRIYTIDSLKQLVFAKEPLHFYQPGFSGLDCGRSFALTLLPYLPEGTRICLVPCAISSTTIQDWLDDSNQGVYIYSNLLERTRIAQQHGVLKGILWHQGEANSVRDYLADGYDSAMVQFVGKLRQDLQAPSLNFYAGTLAPFCTEPYKDSINAALYRVASWLGHFTVVSTAGLTCKPDSLHFDAAGQRGMGQRFAIAAAAHL